MRIQFAAPIKNRHGDDIKEAAPTEADPRATRTVTLGDICCACLDMNIPEDKAEQAKEKVHRWELIQAITKADKEISPLDLTASDIALIQGRLLKTNLTASVVGFCHQLLDTPVADVPQSKSKAA